MRALLDLLVALRGTITVAARRLNPTTLVATAAVAALAGMALVVALVLSSGDHGGSTLGGTDAGAVPGTEASGRPGAAGASTGHRTVAGTRPGHVARRPAQPATTRAGRGAPTAPPSAPAVSGATPAPPPSAPVPKPGAQAPGTTTATSAAPPTTAPATPSGPGTGTGSDGLVANLLDALGFTP